MHTALQCYIRDSQFNNDLNYENIRKNADDMYDLLMAADTFLELLYPCSSTQLVTSTDRQGRVALHWAAKHFGYWACAWGLRDVCPDGSKIESYAVLLEKLIATGADVHAVNSRHETPLMTLLNQFMTFRNWPICALSRLKGGARLLPKPA
jgi:hypothetical protein